MHLFREERILGSIDNAARDIAAPVKRAGEVGDGRLKALYALQAGMNARDIQKNQKTDKAINKNNAVGINISLGSTGWKDHAETVTEEARGSRITATSAISKGTITITDKENQKQDIEKLNRNTEDSLNKLKEIFDKTKVEERKQLLEELGIVGNRAIHEIASHNGWKDGSTEKVALHGMLGAITGAKSGGSALSGLIAGGANEYAIGYLKKTKGKDWINKHPDTVQNISAAFGGILSKMTGGSGHTGAYISQMGTKWNELDEEMEAREAVKEIIEKEVWNQIENSKESTAKEVMRKAHYLVDKGIIDPTNMIGDYVSTQLSLGEGLKAGAVGCIVDKEGNVYATLAFAPGGTVGVPLMTGYGFLSDKSDGYINSISGLSGSFSAIGGVGGELSEFLVLVLLVRLMQVDP